MEIVNKLPDRKQFVIGTREIAKAVQAGKLKRVIIASNCPDYLIDKFTDMKGVLLEKFFEDESQLGTKLGKPFPVAMVGYE
jgi:ribosomal protein L30E